MTATTSGAGTGDARARVFRALRRTAWGLLGLFLAYLVGANLVLVGGALDPLINRKPEKLLVEWSHGWSWLPGVVHVEGLRIRGQSRSVQWQCRLDRGTFRLSLVAFATKTVRIRRGHGDGFAFHLRRRADAAAGRDTPATGLPGDVPLGVPEIEGLSNPPDPAPEQLYGPPPARRQRWKLDISDVVLSEDVDLWFEQMRVRGRGRIGGGVRHELRGPLEVPRAFLTLEDATIAIAGDALAHDFALTVEDAGLTPFVPRETKGRAVLGHFTGNLRIDGGRIDDVSALRALLPAGAAVEATGGSGRLDVDLRTPLPGQSAGTLALDLDGLALTVGDRPIEGNVRVRVELIEGDHAAGRYRLGDARVAFENMLLPGGGATADGWWGRLAIDDGTIALGRPLGIEADAALELKDSRPLLATFLGRPAADGGDLRVPAWVKLVPNVRDLHGTLRLEQGPAGTAFEDIVLHGDKTEILARMYLRDKRATGQLYVNYGILHLGVELSADGTELHWTKPKEWFLASGAAGGPAELRRRTAPTGTR